VGLEPRTVPPRKPVVLLEQQITREEVWLGQPLCSPTICMPRPFVHPGWPSNANVSPTIRCLGKEVTNRHMYFLGDPDRCFNWHVDCQAKEAFARKVGHDYDILSCY